LKKVKKPIHIVWETQQDVLPTLFKNKDAVMRNAQKWLCETNMETLFNMRSDPTSWPLLPTCMTPKEKLTGITFTLRWDIIATLSFRDSPDSPDSFCAVSNNEIERTNTLDGFTRADVTSDGSDTGRSAKRVKRVQRVKVTEAIRDMQKLIENIRL
jgi:hypothetical protein